MKRALRLTEDCPQHCKEKLAEIKTQSKQKLHARITHAKKKESKRLEDKSSQVRKVNRKNPRISRKRYFYISEKL